MTLNSHEIFEGNPASGMILTCDHASNRVPDEIGDIGLSAYDMSRHIAYDVGARGVTLAMAQHTNSTAILSRFSRIVIDPNRSETDPTLVRRIYDRSVIEGNRHADNAEVARRIATYYAPYHTAITQQITHTRAMGITPAIVAIHSYTPQMMGRPPRPWHVGILWDGIDGRIAQPLMDRLRADGFCVGDNEPYPGTYGDDSQDRHAMQPGLPNVLIEVRNDLIEDEAGQKEWADRLSTHLMPIISNL
ncbi:Predicted N-formylglutamate amidohydrolase [Monaibacterium marinum]|uniref:Predicted N-formylglutamate amidohydrolase n=1 Tax=Pontivivens marinum TaxID=1690039 RepID=A0A2C9CMI7_9RHOB|nr:N-formylglutamate amidohydrolase [Monaibacterium marinum]SOH92524.1 Predicted N-formylglutamate amidohydrolase [Monaibacterium marinum]